MKGGVRTLFRRVSAGIEIGAYTLKYAAMDAEKRRILGLWSAEIMPERESREQSLKYEELRSRLIELVKRCQTECPAFKKEVQAAIQGDGTFIHYIELPEEAAGSVEVAVRAHAVKLIPFPLEKMTITHVKVPLISPEKKGIGVLLVAALRESVDYAKLLLEACGLEVQRMELPALALAREFSYNYHMPKDQFFLLVHIGFKHTQVVLLKDRYPYLTREFSLGGRDFTYAIQMGSQIPWQEAEQRKRDYDTMEKLIELEPFLQRWLAEIKRSIDFCSRHFRGVELPLQAVYISGGTKSWRNLDRRLSEYLAIPVHVHNLNHIEFEVKSRQAGAPETHMVTMGLALAD